MLSRCIPKSLWGVKPTLKFSSRLYHNAVAKFTNIDKKGMPVSYDIAFRRDVVSQLGSDGAHQVVTLPLRFDHRSLHFIHQSFPLPRIEIHQNLGDSKHDVSSATLWLTGNWNAVTLDGSPDEDFERMSRETAVKLKGALDKLKDKVASLVTK
ncbi:hypothetical protein FOBRF1_008889 [Fusarium oxysporum]